MEYNEPLLIELYNLGKDDIELGELFKVSDRTVERWLKKLRLRGKIGYRMGKSGKEKNKFKQSEIFPEVQSYLDNAKKVISACKDVYSRITQKSTWDGTKQNEDLLVMWSDMHTGMRNTHPKTGKVTYDDKIQQEELGTFVAGIERFANLYKPVYNIETFYIADLGDNVTNDRIFYGQQMEITCQIGEQILKCFEYQSQAIRKLLEIFPKVVMVKLVGNHGRTTDKPLSSEEASSNFEYLLGIMLKERFANNPRVQIIVPNSYSYDLNIRGHKYYLTHGNVIKGGTLNSIEHTAQKLALLFADEQYDAILIGHFHTALEFLITPRTKLMVNGCWITGDSFAYNVLKKFSEAKQIMFSISNKSAIHNEQKIDLKWK
jgi:predicted phosphodiesterase